MATPRKLPYMDHTNEHHTKTSGDLAVYKAILDLHEQGFVVADPLTEHAPFDLIVWKGGESDTVQVKYRSKDQGKVEVQFRATHWNSDGSYNRKVDTDLIDYYCVYCPESDECYYIDPDNFGESVTIRIDEPENNQSEGINFASDYRQVP